MENNTASINLLKGLYYEYMYRVYSKDMGDKEIAFLEWIVKLGYNRRYVMERLDYIIDDE